MPPPAGPLLHATLIAADSAPLQQAYAALGLHVQSAGVVSAEQAAAWQQPQWAGCTWTMLGAAGAPPLLRLLQVPGARPRPTRYSRGWLALEVLVRDVDALRAPAAAAGFEVIGEPADLDVSPSIRAMQLIGPAGEMLYLTQVKAPVPPFELPLSTAIPNERNLDRLFIAVLSTPSREATVAACAAHAPAAVLRFETKITVLNRAFGRELTATWPVATLQWAGATLFEVDEVLQPTVTATVGVPDGLAWVTMRCDGPAGLSEWSPGAWVETVPG